MECWKILVSAFRVCDGVLSSLMNEEKLISFSLMDVRFYDVVFVACWLQNDTVWQDSMCEMDELQCD